MNTLQQRQSLESEGYFHGKYGVKSGVMAYAWCIGGAMVTAYGVHVEDTSTAVAGLINVGIGAYGVYVMALHANEALDIRRNADMFNVTEALIPLEDASQPPVAMTVAV